MDPFDSFVVFSIKHGMGNVNDLHELQTRSVFRGHTVPLAPTADARRLFAPTAGTQCLSRLRRTHGVFSCLRRPLRKQTAKSLLSAPYGKALQRQAKIFIQAKITVPPHVRNRRIKHSKSLTLGIPRVRDLLFIRKKTSLFFRCLVHDYAIVTVQWTHSVFSRLRRAHSAFRAYGVPYGSKPQRVCFLLHIGSPKETLSQSSRYNVSQRSGPAGWCKRPCSGPACRWHRLCSSSRCRSSPRTAS